jgi:transposase-like protein
MLCLETEVRTSKYLNNIVEQDHRRVKQRIYPMLGFKNFRHAAVTISGIELVQEIRKGQFDTSQVAIGTRVSVAHIWEMVIAT